MIEIPGYIKPETWAAFCDMRRLKGQRAPWTEFAAIRIIGKLQDIHAQGYDADEVLAESVVRGWSSVFITAETPRINPAVALTSSYVAELGAKKGNPMPAAVRERLGDMLPSNRKMQ